MDGGYYIVTSKVVGDNLPLMDTRLQYKACSQVGDEQSFPGECFYEFERTKTSSCKKDPNTNLLLDTRFNNTNYNVTEYNLEYQSGILNGLARQPGYTTNSLRGCPNYRSQKQGELNSPFIRPTLPWKISCEDDGLTRPMVW